MEPGAAGMFPHRRRLARPDRLGGAGAAWGARGRHWRRVDLPRIDTFSTRPAPGSAHHRSERQPGGAKPSGFPWTECRKRPAVCGFPR